MAKNPQIRFRGFSEDWKNTQLGEIYDFLKGKGLSKDRLSYRGKNKCILYGEIFTRYDFEVDGDISKTDFDDGVPSVAGDLIMPGSTTTDGIDLAKAIHVPEDGILYGGDIIVLRPKDAGDVNSYFQSTLISSVNREQIASLAQGITIVHLHGYDLFDLFYSMPTKGEQDKVGNLFKDVDQLINHRQSQLDKLRQLRASLLLQIFPREGSDTPSLRFKGYDGAWDRMKVEDLFILRNGYTPSTSNSAYWSKGTIPWFRMDDIRDQGHIMEDSALHITPEAVKGGGLFPAGSIIVSTSATIGEHALIKKDYLANQRFTVLQSKNHWATVDMMFFYHYCFVLCEWCKKNVNVGGFDAVNITDLRQHMVPFPSIEEQRQIADFLSALEDRITFATKQITKLKRFKQAILEKMLVA